MFAYKFHQHLLLTKHDVYLLLYADGMVTLSINYIVDLYMNNIELVPLLSSK